MVTSVQSSVTDLTATVATQLSRADVTLGERFSTLNTSITRSVAGQMAAAATAMAAVNRSVIAALATKDSAVKNVWIGGCSSHQYGGWKTICLDREFRSCRIDRTVRRALRWAFNRRRVWQKNEVI